MGGRASIGCWGDAAEIGWRREIAGEELRVAGRSLEVWCHPEPWYLACQLWWDGNPYNLTITLPLMHIWFEHDGGNNWPWEWTILRLIIGKQEIRTDLALNYWGLGVAVHQTDDWSIHLGPLDIECEYDKFYDLDDDWIGRANLRLFSKYASLASASTNLFGMIDQNRHPKMDWRVSPEGSD